MDKEELLRQIRKILIHRNQQMPYKNDAIFEYKILIAARGLGIDGIELTLRMRVRKVGGLAH